MFLQQVKALFLAGLGMLGGLLFPLSCLGASVDSTALTSEIKGAVKPTSSAPVTAYLHIKIMTWNSNITCIAERTSGISALFSILYVACPSGTIMDSPPITDNMVQACYCSEKCAPQSSIAGYTGRSNHAPAIEITVHCRIPLLIAVSDKVAHTVGEVEEVIVRGMRFYVTHNESEFLMEQIKGYEITAALTVESSDINAQNLQQVRSIGTDFSDEIFDIIPKDRWPIKFVFFEACSKFRKDPNYLHNSCLDPFIK